LPQPWKPFLDQYWDELDESMLWLDLEVLLQEWPNFQPAELKTSHHFDNEHEAQIHERVGVFWGLLFLSAQSKVELAQENFYQDLKVQKSQACSP
jgi:segregation and condensation protein A